MVPYEGPTQRIEDGSWEQEAKAALAANPEKYSLSVLGCGGNSLKQLIDFALPILHGPYGEDGTIQGMFEMIDIPYGGSGVTGAALTMDKILAKAVCERAGLPVGPYVALTIEDYKQRGSRLLQQIESELRYPMFVKPSNMGSSVGITKVRAKEELGEAIVNAAKYDRRILVEEGIDCRELETAVLGNFHPQVSCVGEIIPRQSSTTWAKYFDGGKSSCAYPRIYLRRKLKSTRNCSKSYKVLDCCGYKRGRLFHGEGNR